MKKFYSDVALTAFILAVAIGLVSLIVRCEQIREYDKKIQQIKDESGIK